MMYCHIIDKIDNIDMDECLLKQCNVTDLLDFEYILFVRIFLAIREHLVILGCQYLVPSHGRTLYSTLVPNYS